MGSIRVTAWSNPERDDIVGQHHASSEVAES